MTLQFLWALSGKLLCGCHFSFFAYAKKLIAHQPHNFSSRKFHVSTVSELY